ncbi:unnamed protein product [Adineta ricciae]|uniref:Uncharacterized protein n=1 Tax=Adineta ricciae TaxID=249248 RepID=A0A815GEY8_ADIRI|nr:unnamed protein product [Adineta ricciae]CAF1338879.1 unnamed protein product [Adineta ricciae]
MSWLDYSTTINNQELDSWYWRFMDVVPLERKWSFTKCISTCCCKTFSTLPYPPTHIVITTGGNDLGVAAKLITLKT